MLVATLFGHDGIPGDVLRGALDRAAVVIHHADALLREYSDVAIGQEKYLAGVLEERRDVAGHKKFALAQADHGGRSHARGHDFMRVFRGQEYQRVDAAQFFQRPADCFLQRRILGILFDEVRDDFGVGFGDELMALALQLLFQLQVIFDDAVVNYHNLPGAVAMRVRVFFRGTAMRGPTCMSDSIRAFNRRFLESFLKVPQFSWRAADFQLAVVHYGNSGGVVTAVFQFAQAFNYDGNDFFRSYVTDNSAHNVTSPEEALIVKRNTEFLGDCITGNRPDRECWPGVRGSLHDFKSIFFDHRVGEHFLGNALELRLRFVAAPAVKIQHEEFSLAHVTNLLVAKPGERVLNGLPLRIEDRAFRHHPNMCFHKAKYNSGDAISACRRASPAADLQCHPLVTYCLRVYIGRWDGRI